MTAANERPRSPNWLMDDGDLEVPTTLGVPQNLVGVAGGDCNEAKARSPNELC